MRENENEDVNDEDIDNNSNVPDGHSANKNNKDNK
jgi:hypothetical protein